MKLNLRKASVVQQTIVDEIKRIGSEDTSINVSLYEANVEAKLDEQMTKIIDTNARVGRLMEANRFLRATVARKNAEVGIADYLAEEAMLASAEGRLKTISETPVRQSIDAITKEIDARKASATSERSMYGTSYSTSVAVVTKGVVDQAKAELERVRRRRRKIKDEMVTINVRTEFEVPEQVALVLTELGLD
jgi:hypothetical protein